MGVPDRRTRAEALARLELWPDVAATSDWNVTLTTARTYLVLDGTWVLPVHVAALAVHAVGVLASP